MLQIKELLAQVRQGLEPNFIHHFVTIQATQGRSDQSSVTRPIAKPPVIASNLFPTTPLT